MPRAPSEQMIEAEKLFHDGKTMVEIAKQLGISDGTVRSWKNRYGWGDRSKKNKRNVAKKMTKKLQRCKRKKEADSPEIRIPKGCPKVRGTRIQSRRRT